MGVLLGEHEAGLPTHLVPCEGGFCFLQVQTSALGKGQNVTIKVTSIGHATTLIELGDFRLLTDPVFSPKIGVSLGGWVIGTPRLQPPALHIEELPPIDAVLLSHAHFDHADKPSLKRLSREAVAVVHRGNRDLIKRFAQRHVLQWGDTIWLEREGKPFVKVTGTAAKHWGARTLFDQWRGWGGFLLEVPSVPSPTMPGQPFSILFSGDTAQTDAFHRLRQQREGRGVDLAIMPIGAYDPWIMNHCNPEQAWDMAMNDLGAHWLMPIHYGVFALSNEPLDEPMARLWAAAQAAGQESRVVGSPIGEPFVVSLPVNT